MPRIVLDAFLDPSNTASSIAASPSRVINEYNEVVAPGHGKSERWGVRRPGLHPFATLSTGPVRGTFQINDRGFAVSAATFAEVFSDGSTGHSATVANDGLPVSWASSGTASHQILIASAGLGYVYDLNTNVLTQVTDVDFPSPCRCVEYFNGFFFALQGGGSRQFQWSAAEDATDWPALNFLQTESPDNLTSFLRNHTELWLLGFRTSSVIVPTQDANNPYAPIPNVWIEQGAQGIFTPQRMDNTIAWMGLGENGQGMVFTAGGGGYTPTRISTHAVEYDLQNASTPTDARACVFQMGGHIFYSLLLPRIDLTWVYDRTTQEWFQWGHWDATAMQWKPFIANNHTFVFNTHLVGSRVDGTIYEMSQNFYDDQLTAL